MDELCYIHTIEYYFTTEKVLLIQITTSINLKVIIMSRARSQAQRNTRFHYIKLTKSQMPFHHGGWNAKVRSQETLGITCKVGPEVQNKAGQRLTELRERTGHGKHPLSITH